MKSLFLCAVVAALTMVCGCSNPEQKAVKSFELIVTHLKGLTTSGGKPKYSDFSFNVTKTDSLVSPFAGVITFKVTRHCALTCHFAQQDGKWVHKSINGEVQYSREESYESSKNAINDEVREKQYQQRLDMDYQFMELFKSGLDSDLAKFLKCPTINI